MTDSLQQLAQDVGQLLEKNGLKIATAESCTAGGLAYWITSIPNSSNWLERGFVTYSNQAKNEMLGVKQITLDEFGAVSEEVAEQMAQGAIIHSKANIGVGITGIAGPGGGSATKPVGLVWLSLSNGTTTKCHKLLLKGDREAIRQQTIKIALEQLIHFIQGTA